MGKHLTLAVGMIILTAVFAAAQAPAEVQKQKLVKNHHIVYVGGDNSDTTSQSSLIEKFYENQFRHIQDPRAPYFLMMSRDGNMAMGIGGVAKFNAAYDFDGTIDGMNFTPYNITIPDKGNPTAFYTSPMNSALFFTVFGNSRRFGDYEIYIEGKFSGPTGKDFLLKKAYGTVGDWTIGYATSTFADPAAQPATVEPQGPNAKVDNTNMLVRYMHKFKKGVAIAASVETPKNMVPSSDTYQSTSVFMPNFSAFVQYGWGKSSHIRLSALAGANRYRDLLANTNRTVASWGLHASTVFSPAAPLTIYGSFSAGQGVGGYFNDLDNGKNNLLGVSNEPGHMYAPWSYSWYAGVQYHWCPSVFSTVVFSQERMLPKSTAEYGASDYKYGWYAVVNTFWEITPRWQMGIEYDMGRRNNMDGSHGMAHRMSMMAQFSF